MNKFSSTSINNKTPNVPINNHIEYEHTRFIYNKPRCDNYAPYSSPLTNANNFPVLYYYHHFQIHIINSNFFIYIQLIHCASVIPVRFLGVISCAKLIIL